ncbi:hypothetical protein PVAP13_1KG183200 [Panicum virgatum]|uniref:Uncharacterized protein n=1 Tax=Panicum virgatum TaxID=38727 RepID=A0A8T0XQ95_PANVG|nr:hypothetical protein PVAP13_1KG183200 [Panicum virgatum]
MELWCAARAGTGGGVVVVVEDLGGSAPGGPARLPPSPLPTERCLGARQCPRLPDPGAGTMGRRPRGRPRRPCTVPCLQPLPCGGDSAPHLRRPPSPGRCSRCPPPHPGGVAASILRGLYSHARAPLERSLAAAGLGTSGRPRTGRARVWALPPAAPRRLQR